jgi:hypothetical protein
VSKRFVWSLSLLLCTLHCGVRADTVTFHNDLSACVEIRRVDIVPYSNLVLAKTMIEVREPIGRCGCSSALASYSSGVDRDGLSQELQHGLLGLTSTGEKLLVLSMEPSLVSRQRITVSLGCAAPR